MLWDSVSLFIVVMTLCAGSRTNVMLFTFLSFGGGEVLKLSSGGELTVFVCITSFGGIFMVSDVVTSGLTVYVFHTKLFLL